MDQYITQTIHMNLDLLRQNPSLAEYLNRPTPLHIPGTLVSVSTGLAIRSNRSYTVF